MKKIVLILLLILLTGCKKEEYYSENLFYMDTVINIKIYDNDKEKVNKAINEINKLYSKYQNIVNYYDENSELYKLNNKQINTVSNELYELIETGVEWYYKTNGLLNINIGPISEIWHDFRNGSIDFPKENILNKDISINNLKLLENNQIINSSSIDLGSFAKGYVTELAGNYLESIGLNYYIINAGGNVKVGKSHKGYYKIGIKSPNDNSNFYIVNGENISVVTSGGYERFYEYNGTSYHHIIDPVTKYPANYVKSVTVIGEDSALCDILSTTLFLMNAEDGKDFIKDLDVSVIWYTLDGKIIKSDGFKYE